MLKGTALAGSWGVASGCYGIFFFLPLPHLLKRKFIFEKYIQTRYLGFYTILYRQEYHFHCAL